jgi:hypothetical protein
MAKSNQVRPLPPGDTWSKITVVLLDRQVAYLDRIAVDIRLRHGAAIARAEMIRGLIEAAWQSGLPLSDAASSQAIVEIVRAAWTRGGRKRR